MKILKDKCPHCGGKLTGVCGGETTEHCEEHFIQDSLLGLVLCFDCMRILSVSSLGDIRDHVAALLSDHAIQQHNDNCVERLD